MDCYRFGCRGLRRISGTLIIAAYDSLVSGRKHTCSKTGSDKKDFDSIIVGVEKAPFPINLLGMLKRYPDRKNEIHYQTGCLEAVRVV